MSTADSGYQKFYHFAALLTVFIWSSTFVSTKILLRTFTPADILFARFILAYLFLWIIYPKRVKWLPFKKEKYFMLAGLLGVFLYYFAENQANRYTYTSNVSLILSAIPVITAILSYFVSQDEHFSIKLLIGFLISISGITAVVISDGELKGLNLKGDILALLAAVVWGCYSITIRKFDHQLSMMIVVRKTLFYGLILISIVYFFSGQPAGLELYFKTSHIFHLLFLGIGASGCAFLLWNKAVKEIGAIKASQYIYLIPVITGILAVVFLNESFNTLKILGMAAILFGVYYSER